MNPRLRAAYVGVVSLSSLAACADDVTLAGDGSSGSGDSTGVPECILTIPAEEIPPSNTNQRTTLIVDEDADFEQLRSVRHIEGGLLIRATSVVDLSMLHCLERVDGWLTIGSNPSLVSLHGLENLEHAERLSVGNNPKLESLEALGPVRSLERGLEINSNDSLHTLGLNSLVEINDFFGIGSCVYDSGVSRAGGTNPMLLEIDGFESLESIRSFVVAGQSQLTDLSNLRLRAEQGLEISSLSFQMNANLPREEIDALESAAGAGSYDVCGNLGDERCDCDPGPD